MACIPHHILNNVILQDNPSRPPPPRALPRLSLSSHPMGSLVVEPVKVMVELAQVPEEEQGVRGKVMGRTRTR